MRILVVEDSPTYQELLVGVCQNLGLETHAVDSGEQGLARLRAEHYELVCVDLHLPDIDGLELCREARKLENGELISLILITSDPDEFLQQKAFDAGVTEILHKTDAAPLQQELDSFIKRVDPRIEGRALYIEDSRSIAALTRSYLLAAGLEVEHFKSADEALSVFLEREFDVVISDIVVEGQLSGIGLLRSIRSLKDNRREIPFLAMSGALDEQRKVTILRQGADDFIAKPAVKDELLARTANLIKKKRLFDQVIAQQQALHDLAITDSLTGLYNKGYLDEAGKQMLSSSQRHRYPMSILILDLDFFKKINDEHGHDVGDRVLKAVGKLVREQSREEDLACRFGGEEFVILLPRCSLSNACNKAESLRAQIEALHPGGLQVTSSIGVSCTRRDQQTKFNSLFKEADQALYEAKANGRNRVVRHSPVLSHTG